MDVLEELNREKMGGYAVLSRLQSLADALLAQQLESDLLSEDYVESELRIFKPGETDALIAVYEVLRDQPEDVDEAQMDVDEAPMDVDEELVGAAEVPAISGFVLKLYKPEGSLDEDALWTGEGELIASRDEELSFDAEDTAAWIRAQID